MPPAPPMPEPTPPAPVPPTPVPQPPVPPAPQPPPPPQPPEPIPAPPPPAPGPPTPIPSPAPEPPPPAATPGASTPATPAGEAAQINLNSVTFEQLREQNLSVTQATRLLAHRERLGGFQSVDDLDQVAGFPGDLLVDLKRRSTI
jgi:hypothetical protein